ANAGGAPVTDAADTALAHPRRVHRHMPLELVVARAGTALAAPSAAPGPAPHVCPVPQPCGGIDSGDSPAGHLLEDRVRSCAESIDALAECADGLAEAYELHLQVVSVGGRIQL